MDDGCKMFDRALLRTRRTRMSARWPAHNFLKREAALRIAERLGEITRAFPLAVDLGCHGGEVAEAVLGKGGIETLLRCDNVEAQRPAIVCDEEWLPFAPDSIDLVMSALSLHHVNDLPGTLIQIRNCLAPQGLFLAVLPGAHTLMELREAVTGAASLHGHALSPRVSPFVDVRDAGALLQRCGFAMPVIDSETIQIDYATPLALMQELRGMGESNVLLARQKHLTTRAQIAGIDAYYRKHFPGDDGGVTATVEFVTLTAWKS